MQINSIKNIVMGTALAAIAGSSVINTCSNTTTQNNLSETAQIIHTPRIVPSHPRYSKDNFSSSQQCDRELLPEKLPERIKRIPYSDYPNQLKSEAEKIDFSAIGNKNGVIDEQEIPSFLKIINDQYKSKKISSEDYFKNKENQLKTVRTPFLPAVKISQAAPEYKNAEKATRLNRTAAAIIAALFAGIFSSISFMFGARAGELIRSKRGQIAGWSIGCIGTLATIFPSYKCYKTVANDLITHKQRELIIQNFNKTIKKEIAEFKIEKSLPVK